MEQPFSKPVEKHVSPGAVSAVIEYASPAPKPRQRIWIGLLALAVYCASLLLPALDFRLFANSSNSWMPGYAAAHAAFSMTIDLFTGQWWGPLPVLGAVANLAVVTSIALLFFSKALRAAAWTAWLAVACMLGCMPLYDDLRVGYVVWLLSALVCAAIAITRRRAARHQ
jgi:hypothetical protein